MINGNVGIPKMCGTEVELGNFIIGLEEKPSGGTGKDAADLLFEEMPGLAVCAKRMDGQVRHSGYAYGSIHGAELYSNCRVGHWANSQQDSDRKFMPSNGGCSYIDHCHLEICLPETLSAFHNLALFHGMLRMVRSAQQRANSKLARGKIQVLINNSDGMGHSYGTHTNFLIHRRCFENIFDRKLHYGIFLASFLASSITFSGAGKVGSENGRPVVDYQISQRADFFESLLGTQTTFKRPIVNSRDEPLCDGSHMARLHVIFFDNTLCHVSSLLKVGVSQIVLAMIEQDQVVCDLILQDPVEAVVAWSHDPDLQTTAATITGSHYTAVDIQLAILEEACKFVGAGRAEGIVPYANEIVELWQDTLFRLKDRDLEALAPRLDWVLKRAVIRRAMRKHPGLRWDSPAVKHLDHLYSSLDDGLFWIYEPGFVRKLVPEEAIGRAVHDPPNDTRAWLRAQILRRGGHVIDSVDWDSIRFKLRVRGDGLWPAYTYRTLSMENPLISQKECQALFEDEDSLEQIIELNGQEETDFYGGPH